MKRFCMMLIVVFVIASCARAEMLDSEVFTQYSDEVLATLASICRAELIRRNGESFTIEPGVYVAGQDFPGGAWRLEMVSGYGSMGSVLAYVDAEAYANDNRYFNLLLSEYSNQTVVGRLYIPAGGILFVDCTMKVTPFLGVKP